MNILKSNKILFAVTLITLLLLIATFAPVRVGAGCMAEACGSCICVGVQDCECAFDVNGCQVICDDEGYECRCVEY